MNAFFGQDMVKRPRGNQSRSNAETAELPLKRKIFTEELPSEAQDDDGGLSFSDIIKGFQASLAQGTSKASSKKFKIVQSPNPYFQEKAGKQIVIKMFDVLFNDRTCNLIYMKELPSDNNEEEKDNGQLIKLTMEIVIC